MSYQLLWSISRANTKTGAIPTAWPDSYNAAWASCEGCALRPDAARETERDPCYGWDGNGGRALGSVLRGAERNPTRYSLRACLDSAPRLAKFARVGPLGDPADADRQALLWALDTLQAERWGILGYTHFWERADVKRDLGAFLRASCDDLGAELKATRAGWATAVVLPWDFEGKTFRTEDGRKGIACPAQYRDVTCNQCGLCDTGKAGATPIGFVEHASRARAKRRRLPVAGAAR